jgi:hypothetical protein
MITNEGLEDQLLSITIARERSQLEEERNSIVLNSAKNKKFKKERFLFSLIIIFFNSIENCMN